MAENLLLGIEMNLSMLCLAQNMYTQTYNILARMRHGNNSFFGKKYLLSTRNAKDDERDLDHDHDYCVVTFHFFTCLLVSPCGDYLPASDSVSFIPFYLLAFQCLHAVIICLLDMDRMSVLVLLGRY